MYDIFKNRILAGGYQLTDMQQRIKKLYAMGELTETQLDELITLSQRNATADTERPEMLKLLRKLSERVEALEKLVLSQDDEDPETAEHETWAPWDGISNKYQPGAIVAHNGKLWKSVFAGHNIWEPGAAGTESLWVEYKEEVAEDV